MPPLSHEVSTIAAFVQKCTGITAVKQARQLHAIIVTTTGAQSTYINNNLISMYARCGSLGDAHQVFDKMHLRNIVSYNALAAALSRNPNRARSAFNLITQMEFECLRPNGSTFTSLLQASAVLEDRLIGATLHTQVVKLGYDIDICVQTSLLGMYSSCGDMEGARNVFDSIAAKDDVAWNSMILGNLKNEKIKEGLCMFSDMVRSYVTPTQFTYSMVLNGCSKLREYNHGRLIHSRVIVSNVVVDLPLQNAMLDMYCNCGDMETAFHVFHRIKNADLVSWNSVITGCGDGENAMELFIQLRRLSVPKPDEYTFAAVVSVTGDLAASVYGKPLHGQVTKTGFDTSVYVGTTLVSMYFRNSDTESARKVFSLISEKDVVLWTEMIMGQSRVVDGESAMHVFREMYREGGKIDSFVLSGALGACADLATLRQGEMIHSLAIKTGHNAEITVSGSLVDLYGKNGNLAAAQSIFSVVSNPDLKCWNSMLGAYGHHGKPDEAFKLFDEIVKHGLKPDQVTYLSILSACSHSGLTERGKFLWNYMKENDCMIGPKHYSCMVSLLSRAGLLYEAEELISRSPYCDDHPELWRTLLSSCVASRNLRIGFRAAERVLNLDAEDGATHILLSNLYAATGRWDRVVEMRKKIRGLMLEKDPGLSWIEAKKSVQVFSSNDQCHPEVSVAYAEVHRLQDNMIKSFGCELDSKICSS